MSRVKVLTIKTIIILALFSFAVCFVKHITRHTYNVVVSKTERVSTNDGGRYLVFTDKGVFEITDSICFWQWDSSDKYGKISSMIGKNIEIEVYSLRVPFLSWYQNIVDIKQKK